MTGLLETIIISLQDIVGNLIRTLPGLIAGIIILLLARYGAKFSQKVARKIGKKTIRSASLRLLLQKTSYVLAFTAGVLFAAVVAFPGLRLGDIIAALGLGSVAIGFAFQDIFKNFLAGILLLLQEPFRIGDQIIVAGYEGTVEHIDIRTTRIRTYQGEEVIVPNATVFTSEIQVRTAYDYRRTNLGVGVDYNTSLPMAKERLQNILQEVEGVLDNPQPEIDLVGFGDSSIDFVVRYWTIPQQHIVRRIQTQVIIAIKRDFDQAEINIPYPIRTVYYYDQQRFNDYLPLPNQEID
ncbi:mechanosensitive ion channel family protein [Dactylococcopsis salina]|uniref:Small-conductance mechanosensitive channel n=1 Tax=Dactylococcopsis salina (strain PCC 8305) TaxID=13035 RepID=K9YSE0_DACS8|nr:mechanosensitive ion channel family protein [Dactylococcopsis salina]AFZ49245.1 small-conductance mechanosensitive channel [Dactylococcopsis salina PCC 8305]